ncbi:MAG: hypothetical protein FIB06_08400 [Betaproteobacteria bacterium]|nr:hypothetical protein [Betaproteobacteria bacterium]
MPYVKRDQQGQITAVWKEQSEPGTEFIHEGDDELALFLGFSQGGGSGEFSIATDLQMVRVIEDVINLLIAKHVIVLTDLPEAVQNKLLQQRHRRENLLGSTTIIQEGEQRLF